MSAYSDYAAAVSRILENKGNAIAAGQERSGQIWGQTISSLGKTVGDLPQQAQQAKTEQLKNQVTQAQLTAMQTAQAAQARADAVVAGMPRNEDGTYDTGKLLQSLSAQNIPVDQIERLSSTVEKINGVQTSFNTAQTDHAADLANAILTSHQPDEPITADSVHLGMATAKAMGLASDQTVQKLTAAMGAGADPEQVLKQIRSSSEKYKGKNVPLKADERLVSDTTGTVVVPAASSGAKTEAEIALDAATAGTPQETATAANSVRALKMLKTAGGTAEADDNRYRNIQAAMLQKQPISAEDQAWAQGYEKQKTLGVDSAAAAATDRQTKTLAAEIDRQRAQQGFTEKEAGRAALTKVDEKYNEAVGQAQLLRNVIASAQAGNKLSANMQNLITTLTTARAENLSRINQIELNAPATAGTAWDRVVGWFGKATTGDPVPANIQKDMQDYAQILQTAAFQNASASHDLIKTRYGLTDEPALKPPTDISTSAPAASIPSPVTAALKGQKAGKYTLKNGTAWIVGTDGSITPAK